MNEEEIYKSMLIPYKKNPDVVDQKKNLMFIVVLIFQKNMIILL